MRGDFSEYFGFPCQFSFHQLLHTHHTLSGAGTIGQLVAEVPSGLSLTPPQEEKLAPSLLIGRVRFDSFQRQGLFYSALCLHPSWVPFHSAEQLGLEENFTEVRGRLLKCEDGYLSNFKIASSFPRYAILSWNLSTDAALCFSHCMRVATSFGFSQ
jgi:hypothetical protein